MTSAAFSCVLSASDADAAFAQQLAARLRAAGLTVWYAPEDMLGGQKQYDQIARAIAERDKLLIVLSQASMASGWMETAIRRARALELRTGQPRLFPIRLTDLATYNDWVLFSDEEGRDLVVEVRSYFIPDFSHWQEPAAFDAAFTRLLRDLGTGSPAASTPALPSVAPPAYTPTEDDRRAQHERLALARGTLQHYLKQQAIHSTAYVTPSIAYGISEARGEIRRVKATLWGWGQQMSDHPDDVHE